MKVNTLKSISAHEGYLIRGMILQYLLHFSLSPWEQIPPAPSSNTAPQTKRSTSAVPNYFLAWILDGAFYLLPSDLGARCLFFLEGSWARPSLPQPTTAPSSAARPAPCGRSAGSAPAAAPSACGAATWSSAWTPTPTWPPSPTGSAWSGTPWAVVRVSSLLRRLGWAGVESLGTLDSAGRRTPCIGRTEKSLDKGNE